MVPKSVDHRVVSRLSCCLGTGKPFGMVNDSNTYPSVNSSRRSFVKASAIALSAVATLHVQAATEAKRKLSGLVSPNDVVLFQGDSITDAGRNREAGTQANAQSGLGSGYAWLAAAELLVDHPEAKLKVYNRGNSGNKVHQLAERWQADCLELRPNVLSILIGVNDFWHMQNGNYKGTVEVYERDYRALLTETKKALPKIKLIICEPFVLRCGAVSDKWFPEFDVYRAAARRVAKDFKTAFVPFQSIFDQAVAYAPAAHWAGDGVHPSAAGASLMAHHWLQAAVAKR